MAGRRQAHSDVPAFWRAECCDERDDRVQSDTDPFREKHGEPSGRFENAPILLLTTTGGRSGEARTAPLMYVRDGDRLIVFASNAGAVRPPYWHENLLVDSNVIVELGAERFSARATTTGGEDRARLFASAIESYPFFIDHEATAGRQIPLVALERVGASDSSSG